MINTSEQDDNEAVVAALAAVGEHVQSAYDLLGVRGVSEPVIRALAEVLPTVANIRVREGVVRALTDRAARGVAGGALVDELRRARDRGEELLAWAVGNALVLAADDSQFDDLCELAVDRRLGKGRETVVEALGSFKRQRPISLLRRLLRDEKVAGHALIALRRLRAREAVGDIEPMLSHEKAWIRREAGRALKALGKPEPPR